MKTKKLNFIAIKSFIKLLIPLKIKIFLKKFSQFLKWHHDYLIKVNVKNILLDK